MSKSNFLESKMLRHVFLNEAIAGIGDATGLPAAAAAGSLYVSLHTADPGEAGDQSTSEASYSGYSRKPVARSGSGWSETGGTATNVAAIAFDECTAGTATITHFAIGTAASGAGSLLYKGAFTASIAVSAGTSPSVAAGGLTIQEN